jgi:hypothetical protein
VFAVLTVLVLELRPPKLPTFKALLLLWPTWLSYAVSYLFIAIVWTNHHHLMRYATEATPRLMRFNFAHLFSVSLLPLSTAWMNGSVFASQRRASRDHCAVKGCQRNPARAIWKLEAALKCRSRKKVRYAPPVHMIKLTQEREITPYVWVHPDDDDRR